MPSGPGDVGGILSLGEAEWTMQFPGAKSTPGVLSFKVLLAPELYDLPALGS